MAALGSSKVNASTASPPRCIEVISASGPAEERSRCRSLQNRNGTEFRATSRSEGLWSNQCLFEIVTSAVTATPSSAGGEGRPAAMRRRAPSVESHETDDRKAIRSWGTACGKTGMGPWVPTNLWTLDLLQHGACRTRMYGNERPLQAKRPGEDGPLPLAQFRTSGRRGVRVVGSVCTPVLRAPSLGSANPGPCRWHVGCSVG